MIIHTAEYPVNIYADGGCIGKNPSEIGITWAFCMTDERDELVLQHSGSILLPNGTNNVAELYACVFALESLDAGWSGKLHSDSKITLGRLFEGWAWRNVPLELVRRASASLERLGAVTPVHLDGHPTKAHLKSGVGKRGNPVSRWNVYCDDLCNREKLKV